MKALKLLRRDERGLSAIEFGLIMPVFFGLLLGMTQLGSLYWSNADIKNAVAAGARLASVYPTPSDADIKARISAKVVGLDQKYIEAPTITRGEDADGNQYADIEMGYKVPLDFVFYKTPPVTLKEKRRVYLQVETPEDEGAAGGGSSTSASTSSSTSASSTSSTSSASSTGGDGWPSTSSTSGGTTTTTSGGTTTTTSGGTTTTTSGGSSSHGNSNGGHDHGKGKDKDK